MHRFFSFLSILLIPAGASASGTFSTAWKGSFRIVPEITYNTLWRLSGAEQRKADLFFTKATAQFRAEPLLTRCNGYSVFIRRGFLEPTSHNRTLNSPFPGQSVQFSIKASLQAFVRGPEGKVAVWDASASSLELTANSPGELFRHFKMSYRGLQDRHDNEIFFAPKKLSASGAVTRYEKDLVVIHRRPVPLFIPVSREEYLQALIDRYDPARGGRAANRMMADFFRRELAAQTPAQRKAPALHSPDSGSPSGLTESAGRPLVKIHPAFFDRKKPRTAVQLLVFRFVYYVPKHTLRENTSRFEQDGTAWVMLRLQRRFNTTQIASLLD